MTYIGVVVRAPGGGVKGELRFVLQVTSYHLARLAFHLY